MTFMTYKELIQIDDLMKLMERYLQAPPKNVRFSKVTQTLLNTCKKNSERAYETLRLP